MSNASVGDSDVDQIDLTSDDDDHSDLDDHEEATPVPEPIILQVDEYGAPVLHIVKGPEAVDPMDIDDPEVPDDGDQGHAAGEEEGLFVEQDANVGQPPSPHSSNDSDSDAEGSDNDANGGGGGGGGHGGDPGDNDPDDDGSDDGSSDASSDSDGSNDNDPSDEEDNQNNDLIDDRNPYAGLIEALEEEEIQLPQWAGNCRVTCFPHWEELGNAFLRFRRMFLKKKTELRKTVGRHNVRVAGLNQTIGALEEAVREFYAANRANIDVNRELNNEIDFLRGLLTPEQRADLPDREPLPLEDMRASLPQAILELLPPDIQQHLRTWRRSRAKPRHTRRTWQKAYRFWIRHGRHPDWENWGDIYKLSCREENMSWALGNPISPKTHPYLKLRPPTDDEEAKAIGGEGCSPQPVYRRPRLGSEEEVHPFRFNELENEAKIMILRYLLVFDGEIVHAISRLDPFYEPSSVHRNCNGQLSLFHRFHIGREEVSLTFGTIHPQILLAPLLVCKQWNLIGSSLFYGANKCKLQHVQHIELLWMGSQKLTYERDERGKYTSRRTHDLAYLPEACRLKSVSIHLPESAKQYMRRKHEPSQMVDFLVNKTTGQPNFRRFRSLRTLQGLDYLHCLRGIHEMTFWDYTKWRKSELKMPVRDWTFVRDINDVVRREKTLEDEHFSQLRYLAPLLQGCRPSPELAEMLEEILNPEPQAIGLLSPPPEDGVLYPRPQSPVDLTGDEEDSDAEDQSESEGSDHEDSDNDNGAASDDGSQDSDDDSDDEGDNGDGDGAVNAGDGIGGLAEHDPDHEPHEAGSDDEGDAMLAAALQSILNDFNPGDEEQKYDPRQNLVPWAVNGCTIDLTGDDGENAPKVADENEDELEAAAADQAAMPPPPAPRPEQALEDERGQGQGTREDSLFVRDLSIPRQEEFVTKVESPSPPRNTPPVVANRRSNSRQLLSVTPARQTREESDLFVSPTRYEEIVDLTGTGLPASVPSSRSSSSSGSHGRKRPWSVLNNDEENDENDADDEDDCCIVGSSPKRPRPDDDNAREFDVSY
ncbi:hypothetical protein ACHAPJ_003643 [Fusarium lateritium]